jgi:hypothetical protein
MLTTRKEVLLVNDDVLWKKLYIAAMLELDRASLRNRIDAAQAAIRDEMRNLANDRSANALEDMRAMSDALHNLQTLQRLELKTSAPAHDQGQARAEV